MTRSTMIDVDDLPRNLVGAGDATTLGETFEQTSLRMWQPTIQEYTETGKTDLLHELTAHLERPLIRSVLMQTRWNQVRTAQVLGINRNTLRTKMQSLGIRRAGDAVE